MPILKYVAFLDTSFQIRNDLRLWEKICKSGLFDIWDPRAPYNNLSGKRDPQILLLRIFEINRDLTGMVKPGQHFDLVDAVEFETVRPILPMDSSEHSAQGYDGTHCFREISKCSQISPAIFPVCEGSCNMYGCSVLRDDLAMQV